MPFPSRHARYAGLATSRRVLMVTILAGCAVFATACGSGGGGSAGSTSASAAVSSTISTPSPTAGSGASSAEPATGEVEKVEVSGSAAPSTVEPAITSAASSQTAPASEASTQDSPPPSAVAQVVDGACAPAPASSQPATSTGAVPVEAFVCDFAGTAPGATVTFLQWGSVDDAFSYYQDAAGLGPRIENYDQWQVSGVKQGPLWTNAPGGRTLSTGAYDAVPYTWQISTATLDDSNAVFGKVTFKSASALS